MDHSHEQKKQPFDNKVIIITGGGTGIGQAAARHFASLGGNVLIAGRHVETLQQTAQGYPNIASIKADISREDEAIAVVRHAEERWGRVDVLINNAATGSVAPLETVTTELLLSTFTLNLFAPVWLSKAALSSLTTSKGTILNVSSVVGHKPYASLPYYAVSKAALEHWTRCMALELAPRGIRVNAVAPGPTATGALERAGIPAPAIEEIRRQDDEKIPLGRTGTPEEVAAYIVSLTDPSSAWITGQVLSVDGGLSISW